VSMQLCMRWHFMAALRSFAPRSRLGARALCAYKKPRRLRGLVSKNVELIAAWGNSPKILNQLLALENMSLRLLLTNIFLDIIVSLDPDQLAAFYLPCNISEALPLGLK